jgi:hypothetical protein
MVLCLKRGVNMGTVPNDTRYDVFFTTRSSTRVVTDYTDLTDMRGDCPPQETEGTEVNDHPDESGRFYDGFPDSSMSGVAILPDPFGQIKGRNARHLRALRFPKGSLSYDPAKSVTGQARRALRLTVPAKTANLLQRVSDPDVNHACRVV